MSCQKQTSDKQAACVSCGGHGWKFVRTRVAVVLRAADEAGASLPRRECLSCGGSGETG